MNKNQTGFTPSLKFGLFLLLPQLSWRDRRPNLNLSPSPLGWKRRQQSKFSAGFTIVEMLVVLAVIGLLASLILVQTRSARTRARDSEREEEIKSLQNALAIYVVNNHLYPVYSGPLTGSDLASTALISQSALAQIPLDPLNVDPTGPEDYRYIYGSADGSTYTLTYYLETNSISGKSAGQQVAGP